jgi:hypothetical protein
MRNPPWWIAALGIPYSAYFLWRYGVWWWLVGLALFAVASGLILLTRGTIRRFADRSSKPS